MTYVKSNSWIQPYWWDKNETSEIENELIYTLCTVFQSMLMPKGLLAKFLSQKIYSLRPFLSFKSIMILCVCMAMAVALWETEEAGPKYFRHAEFELGPTFEMVNDDGLLRFISDRQKMANEFCNLALENCWRWAFSILLECLITYRPQTMHNIK